jgi:hypothetical protein
MKPPKRLLEWCKRLRLEPTPENIEKVKNLTTLEKREMEEKLWKQETSN